MDSSVDNVEENYYTEDFNDTPYAKRPERQRSSPSRHQGGGGPGMSPTHQLHNYVTELVSRNKVVVFSKTQCPHCSDSKTLLNTMGVDYTTVELDQITSGPQLQNVLGEITDARTVPRIFIGGQCVGGNSDLQTLDQAGRLKNMINEL